MLSEDGVLSLPVLLTPALRLLADSTPHRNPSGHPPGRSHPQAVGHPSLPGGDAVLPRRRFQRPLQGAPLGGLQPAVECVRLARPDISGLLPRGYLQHPATRPFVKWSSAGTFHHRAGGARRARPRHDSAANRGPHPCLPMHRGRLLRSSSGCQTVVGMTAELHLAGTAAVVGTPF